MVMPMGESEVIDAAQVMTNTHGTTWAPALSAFAKNERFDGGRGGTVPVASGGTLIDEVETVVNSES